jgi:MFS family permease
MRAVASSLVLLIINMLGLLIGPPITGLISDLLAASMGDESMRYALLIVSVVVLPAAALSYWQAGRSIDADLSRARERD